MNKDYELSDLAPFVARIYVDFKTGVIQFPPDLLAFRGAELLRMMADDWDKVLASYNDKIDRYEWRVKHSGVTSLGDPV